MTAGKSRRKPKSMLSVFESIKQKLDEKGIEYTLTHHEEVRTSEEAARVRGVSQHTGAKALVLFGSKKKMNWLFVLPADMQLDSKKARLIVGDNVTFAMDVEKVVDCVRGSVPPFGSLLGLQTYCDAHLAENEEINFNAGTLTDSIKMKYADYIAIENPTIVDIV